VSVGCRVSGHARRVALWAIVEVLSFQLVIR